MINGGKFTGTKAAIGYYRYKESEAAKITVDGGKYNTDPSAFLAPGYIAVKGSDDYYTLEYDKDLVEAAQAKGLTVLKTGVETGTDGYAAEDGDSFWTRTGVIFRYYKDGKLYIADATDSSGDSSGSYTIPEKVDGIKDWAFTNSKITSVSFTRNLDYAKNAFSTNTTVASIGSWGAMDEVPYRMFAKAKGLASDITLPSTIKKVGRYAFQQTNITSVTVEGTPSDVTKNIRLEDGAFAYCPLLTTITIKDIVTIGTANLDSQTYLARSCASLTDVYFYGNILDFARNSNGICFSHTESGNGEGITFHCYDSYVLGMIKKYCPDLSKANYVIIGQEQNQGQ